MENWAAYLRGQADALGIRVVDTSQLSIERVADALQDEIERLRLQARQTSSPAHVRRLTTG